MKFHQIAIAILMAYSLPADIYLAIRNLSGTSDILIAGAIGVAVWLGFWAAVWAIVTAAVEQAAKRPSDISVREDPIG